MSVKLERDLQNKVLHWLTDEEKNGGLSRHQFAKDMLGDFAGHPILVKCLRQLLNLFQPSSRRLEFALAARQLAFLDISLTKTVSDLATMPDLLLTWPIFANSFQKFSQCRTHPLCAVLP